MKFTLICNHVFKNNIMIHIINTKFTTIVKLKCCQVQEGCFQNRYIASVTNILFYGKAYTILFSYTYICRSDRLVQDSMNLRIIVNGLSKCNHTQT